MLNLFRRHKVVYTDGEIELVLAQAGLWDRESGITDGYTFDMHLSRGGRAVGYISLRMGESPALYYLGHIGYRIEERHRGHGYALKALKLLMPLFRQEGLRDLVITNDPDNLPSRRICEKAGCVLERVAPVPREHREVCMGSTHKCRYILFIPEEKSN